tara:strand:- start:399 stop:1151 length:753 start_codon:yes stop_codon:yes gene_type:complete
VTSDEKVERLQDLYEDYSGCTRCGLCNPTGRARHNVVFGAGNVDADVVIIGEGPGRKEDEFGTPFFEKAPSGELVDQFLSSMNSSRDSVWIDNMVMCRASKADNQHIDRPPNKEELAACRERIFEVIRTIDPKVVLLLGKTALKLTRKWGDYKDELTIPTKEGITSIARAGDPIRLVVEVPGVAIPIRYVAFATFHPSYLNRLKEAELQQKNSDLEMSWRTWRHAFRVADTFNYTYIGDIPPQRGVDTDF